MSPTTSDRAGEFARLLDLFDQLVSRGKKRSSASETPGHATVSQNSCDDTHSSIPDLSPNDTLPVENMTKSNQLKDFYHATASLQFLGSSMNSRTYGGDSVKRSWGRASTASDTTKDGSSHLEEDDKSSVWDEEDDEQASLAKFPMEKQRPFTFKLMLHKLYGREDWIKKVQEALEHSKKEYKPLSESLDDTSVEKEAHFVEDTDEEGGGEFDQGESARVRFTFGKEPPGKITSAYGRQRSLAVATRSTPDEMAREAVGGGIARAVKKRCVGRRKSLNGPLNANAEVEGVGRAWVYDAMISQLENENHSAERGSLRGKGRRRSVSVSGGGTGIGRAADVREVRKRTLTMVVAAIPEGEEDTMS